MNLTNKKYIGIVVLLVLSVFLVVGCINTHPIKEKPLELTQDALNGIWTNGSTFYFFSNDSLCISDTIEGELYAYRIKDGKTLVITDTFGEEDEIICFLGEDKETLTIIGDSVYIFKKGMYNQIFSTSSREKDKTLARKYHSSSF